MISIMWPVVVRPDVRQLDPFLSLTQTPRTPRKSHAPYLALACRPGRGCVFCWCMSVARHSFKFLLQRSSVLYRRGVVRPCPPLCYDRCCPPGAQVSSSISLYSYGQLDYFPMLPISKFTSPGKAHVLNVASRFRSQRTIRVYLNLLVHSIGPY